MADSNSTTVNIPYLGLLGIAFVVLKLTGHITWSWWWVTAPFWAPVVGALLLLALAALAAITMSVILALID